MQRLRPRLGNTARRLKKQVLARNCANAAASQCPFLAQQQKVDKNPQKLNLNILSPPTYLNTSADYNYQEEFLSLDLGAVKKDLITMMRTSQDWWPADYGHYGPFMIRLAWHQAGTYRVADGRGGNAGNIRMYPHNTWPDNGNLDKAVRLLWPVKQKYGKKISWADLIILVGNVAMEDMGFKTFGFGGGRADCWGPDEAYWGVPESFEGLAHEPAKLEQPLGAAVMRLIYVNPEGPDCIPDPLLAAGHIRETFGRMAMNDEETVALVAGGHTFGKCHGAGPDSNVGPEPELAEIENQGFGWMSTYGTGKGKDAITSGLEGAWTEKPTEWDTGYFETLFKYEWELTKSPAGAHQWRPTNGAGEGTVPDAHDPSKRHQPMMLTTDLSMIKDPAYREISERYHKDHELFKLNFAKAWYKLTHKQMGPRRRLLGAEVAPEQIWQDPVPEQAPLHPNDVATLKKKIVAAGLDAGHLLRASWASAATFRNTDSRGGTNGARVRLSPQKDWEVNSPQELGSVLAAYEGIQKDFEQAGGKVSIADLVVLGGYVALEQVGGGNASTEFMSGRGDATADQTDVKNFAYLEPKVDPFRNFNANPSQFVDKASMLGLTPPEMVALVGGMRVLGCNHGASPLGVLTKAPGTLTTDYFVNLLDPNIKWERVNDSQFKGIDRKTGEAAWNASHVDLAIGSNPNLRAIAQHYACSDGFGAFRKDFLSAWTKAMNNGL